MKIKEFKILGFWHAKKAKSNKSWEFQISWIFNPRWILVASLQLDKQKYISINICELLKLDVEKTTQQDHAGFEVNLHILGLDIDYKYYDIRHWNYDEDRWETQEEIDDQNKEYYENLNNSSL